MEAAARDLPPAPSFAAAIREGTDVAIIAELKRRSPSRGVLDASLQAAERARAYVAAGARALSVLTEPEEFGGADRDLAEVRAATNRPVLRKDFHVDPTQVWEARVLGASAVLLIARALGPDGLPRLADTARSAGVEALLEVRDEAELEWALDAGATLIGVNRRDLESLEMDDAVLDRILPMIPPHVIAVAESGVRDRGQVEAVARLGADAVLVGSALSTSVDGRSAVSVLTGVARRGRHA